MSVGGSIFKEVGIRNSDLGVLELMWNPEATRKFRLTMVWAARWAFTRGTGAIETEGPLPVWAKAVAARSTTARNIELDGRAIMRSAYRDLYEILESPPRSSYCQF